MTPKTPPALVADSLVLRIPPARRAKVTVRKKNKAMKLPLFPRLTMLHGKQCEIQKDRFNRMEMTNQK